MNISDNKDVYIKFIINTWDLQLKWYIKLNLPEHLLIWTAIQFWVFLICQVHYDSNNTI